jgi:hypothetical protein
MANEYVFNAIDYAYEYSGGATGQGLSSAGGDTPVLGTSEGAFRFENLQIPKNTVVYSAQFSFYVDARGVGTGGQMKLAAYGIDEDNTADFSSSPFGRSDTSAFTTENGSMPSIGSFANFNVASIVNEIFARSGWSSGNHLGLFIKNNGSDSGYWIADTAHSRLVIKLAADPDFTPTPKSISAPTFPSSTHFGIKISKPGVDVKTATEAQTLFTTRKSIVKVIAEGETTTVGGVEKLFTHGLGYTPSVIGFVEVGGKRVKLNRDIGGSADPIGSGLTGYIGADDTHVSIITSADANVYYYVFIDPLT